jgi:hypothetical protein
VFLLTFRVFMDRTTLMDMLIKRYPFPLFFYVVRFQSRYGVCSLTFSLFFIWHVRRVFWGFADTACAAEVRLIYISILFAKRGASTC